MSGNETSGTGYAERNPIKQGAYYLHHLNAMTVYGLHSKSDIAAELAHRDIEIARLKAHADRLAEVLERAELALAVAASQFAGHDLTRHEVAAEDARTEARLCREALAAYKENTDGR